MAELVVIQNSPVFNDIGPYIYIALRDAKHVGPRGAHVDSIYRGDAARWFLNAHGEHTQRQLFDATPAQREAWGVLGNPNPPGESTHELFSDGVAYPHIPRFHKLPWWGQGFDVPANQVDAVIASARGHGLDLFRPYHSEAELHHLNFREEPKPGGPRQRARIYLLRHTMPRARP